MSTKKMTMGWPFLGAGYGPEVVRKPACHHTNTRGRVRVSCDTSMHMRRQVSVSTLLERVQYAVL